MHLPVLKQVQKCTRKWIFRSLYLSTCWHMFMHWLVQEARSFAFIHECEYWAQPSVHSSIESDLLIVRLYAISVWYRVTNSSYMDVIKIYRFDLPISVTAQNISLLFSFRDDNAQGKTDSLNRTRHPATLTFQALRIFVNDELNQLYNGLKVAHTILKPNGVCAVVSFHSLEHNIVYQVFSTKTVAQQETLITSDLIDNRLFPWKFDRVVTKPSAEEISTNPRSRSAELRVAYKRAVHYWLGSLLISWL